MDAINEIAAALATAQQSIDGARKRNVNPAFKSKYADLASVQEACMDALNKVGIAVVQMPSAEGATVSVTTMLAHKSGQSLSCTVSATAKDAGPQAVGSCITYLRRYGLSAMAGVAPEDDDAEAAEGRGVPKAQPKSTRPDGYEAWRSELADTAKSAGVGQARKDFASAPEAFRVYATQHDKPFLESLRPTVAA